MSSDLNLWHLESLGIARNERELCGDGIVAALIDTGIDGSHPEFVESNLEQYALDMDGNRTELNPPTVNHDWNGHGTMVGGLICGKNVGVAPKATVISIRLEEEQLSLTWVLRALLALLDLKASTNRNIRIVNITYGVDSDGTGDDVTISRTWLQDLQEVFGMLPVVSAGNWPINGTRSLYSCPGNVPEGISVGAADQNGNVWDDSIRGNITLKEFGPYWFPDVVAPGVDLDLCHMGGGYATGSGTSFATALVTGVLCLYLERNPDWGVGDIMRLRNELFMRCQFLPNTSANKQAKCLVQV